MSIAVFNTRWTLAAIALTFIAGIKGAETGQKFFDDDPMTVEPETQDASNVVPFKIDLFYDLLLNQFVRPGLPIGTRARNVNTIDEVPDSSWFTNRIMARPMSIEEAVRGPQGGDGPVAGTWTVVGAKEVGLAHGLVMQGGVGATWLVLFDARCLRRVGLRA